MIADTSFIIDLMRNKPSAVTKLTAIETDKESQKTTNLTVFELATGIAMSNWPEKEKKKVENQLQKFSIINFETIHAYKAGLELGKLLKEGNPVDPIDAQISGIALIENEVIVTRNKKHFERIDGLKIESY